MSKQGSSKQVKAQSAGAGEAENDKAFHKLVEETIELTERQKKIRDIATTAKL